MIHAKTSLSNNQSSPSVYGEVQPLILKQTVTQYVTQLQKKPDSFERQKPFQKPKKKPEAPWVAWALLGGAAIAGASITLAIYHNKAEGKWGNILPTLQEDLGKVFAQAKQKTEVSETHPETPLAPAMPNNPFTPVVQTPAVPNTHPVVQQPNNSLATEAGLPQNAVIPTPTPVTPNTPAPVVVTHTPIPSIQPPTGTAYPSVIIQPFKSQSLSYFIQSPLVLTIIREIKKAEDFTPEKIKQLIPTIDNDIKQVVQDCIEQPKGGVKMMGITVGNFKPHYLNVRSLSDSGLFGRPPFFSDSTESLQKFLTAFYIIQKLKTNPQEFLEQFPKLHQNKTPFDVKALEQRCQQGITQLQKAIDQIQNYENRLVEECMSKPVSSTNKHLSNETHHVFNFNLYNKRVFNPATKKHEFIDEPMNRTDYLQTKQRFINTPIIPNKQADNRTQGLELYFTNYLGSIGSMRSGGGCDAKVFKVTVADNIQEVKNIPPIPTLINTDPSSQNFALKIGTDEHNHLTVDFSPTANTRDSALTSVLLKNTQGKSFCPEQWHLIQSVLLVPELRQSIFRKSTELQLISQLSAVEHSQLTEELKNSVSSYAITNGHHEERYINAGNLFFELKETAEKFIDCPEWQNQSILAKEKLNDLTLSVKDKKQLIANENERLALMGRIFNQCKAQGWQIPPEVEQRYHARYNSPDRLATLWQNDLLEAATTPTH